MDKFIINGGKKLCGEVTISGAKNAAVAIIPATALVEGICRIENIPDIKDVFFLIDILKRMGAQVKYIDNTTLEIDCSHMTIAHVPGELSRKLRASCYFLGALIGRFSHAQVGMPGGCDFGVRSIDQHIKGLETLGAKISIEHGVITAKVQNLAGNSVYFDVISVGATINVMLAAVRAKGLTIIENAAKEPHIVDLANFLNSMGADIMGAGTDLIKIRGVERLYGGTYSIIPDQIEAGTYMAAAAITGGEVLIKNVIPKHLESISAKFIEMGVEITEFDDAVLIKRKGPITKANIKTIPYPGFPTDMQPQAVTLLCLAKGTSIVTEGVFDNRFGYVDEIKRMGVNIKVDGKVAVIEGVPRLTGATLKACDLRGGAAMMLAGLAATGQTVIDETYHIDRGYEDIVGKLQGLGADITRVAIPEKETVLEKAI